MTPAAWGPGITAFVLHRNGFLEPHELTAFLRRLIKGMTAREQTYLLNHLAGGLQQACQP